MATWEHLAISRHCMKLGLKEKERGWHNPAEATIAFFQEQAHLLEGMEKESSSSVGCSGGTSNMGSSLFRMAGLKPISPLASQGHPTRRPLNNLRRDIFQFLRWSRALEWPKSPWFKGLESKQDSWAFISVKRYSGWLKRSTAGVSGGSCAPHISSQFAKRRHLRLALF